MTESSTSQTSPVKAANTAFQWMELGPILFFVLAGLGIWWWWPQGHKGPVHSVAWSPKGKWLASAGQDGKILLRNVSKRKIARRMQVPFRRYRGVQALSVRFHPSNGKLTASYSNKQAVSWDTGKWKWLSSQFFRAHVTRIRFSRNGRRKAFVSGRRVWLDHPLHFKGKHVRLSIRSKAALFSASWDQNGWKLAVVGQGIFHIYTPLKKDKPRILPIPKTQVLRDVAWSPDGRWIATGGSDDKVTLWDTKTWKISRVLKGHYAAVTAIAWSKDGLLASGDANGDIHYWDLKKGRSQQRITGHEKQINDLQWHPLLPLLVSASQDSTVRLWDPSQKKLLQRW